MAEIIPFPPLRDLHDELFGLDLLTAVDVAIRDLTDVLQRWGEEAARQQVRECRLMLEAAYRAAIRDE
jgi:hypothetical protein